MRPFPLIALIFFLIPLIEIYFLIQVGGWIGALPTVALVVLTAVVGVALLRQQGLSTFMRFQASVNRGELPAAEMIEGVILMVGGAFLLTPGFFTDALGFICLLPASRQTLARWLMRRVVVHVQGRHPEQRPGQRIIEGEFREVSGEKKD